jgi:hypothetical protein
MRILFFGKDNSEISSAIQRNLAGRDSSTDIAHCEEDAYELLLRKPELVIIAEQCESIPLITRGKVDTPIMYIHSKPLKNPEKLKERKIRCYPSDSLGSFYVDLSLFIGRIEDGKAV